MIIFRGTLFNIVFRWMVSVLAVSVLAVVSNFASAMSGFELKQKADAYERISTSFDYAKSPTDTLDFAFFMGYVDGVADAAEGRSICFPKDVVKGQVVSMVSKYLREHPEEWNNSGEELVVRALRPTFPCAKK